MKRLQTVESVVFVRSIRLNRLASSLVGVATVLMLPSCSSAYAECEAYPTQVTTLRSPVLGLLPVEKGSDAELEADQVMRCLRTRYKPVTQDGLVRVAVKRDREAKTYFEFLVRGDTDSYILVIKSNTDKIKVFRFSSISGPAI